MKFCKYNDINIIPNSNYRMSSNVKKNKDNFKKYKDNSIRSLYEIENFLCNFCNLKKFIKFYNFFK